MTSIPLGPKIRTANESTLQADVLDTLRALPWCMLERNSVGRAQFGQAVVKFGLCVGASDLLGIVTMESGVGRWFALELKHPDFAKRGPDLGARAARELTEDQALFLGRVNRYGGYACVAACLADALEHAERARAGLPGQVL